MPLKNNISNFLSPPYPYYYQKSTLWGIISILFIMTLFFNYFFEPFEVYVPEHKMNFFWICFVHSCVAAIVIFSFSLFKISQKTEENWNVGKEILLIATILLTIGMCQFLIRDVIYNNPNNWSWRYFYEEIRNTFLEGILFLMVLVPLNFRKLSTKYINNASLINDLKLDTNNLLFAKADGNYVELYLNEKAIISKVLKRITIKELESILEPYTNIIKTHRSYLVNLYQIERVIGNAQGYKLLLKNYDEKIPVSRNMIPDFDARMKNI